MGRRVYRVPRQETICLPVKRRVAEVGRGIASGVASWEISGEIDNFCQDFGELG
jgi:hypothetical protein